MEDMREKQVERVSGAFSGVLGKQIKAAARAIRAGGSASAAVDGVDLGKTYRKEYQAVALLFAGENFNAIESARKGFADAEVSTWAENVNEHLDKFSKKRIKLMNATTKDWIKRTMQAAIDEGLSINQVAKRINEEWAGIDAFRAERIARTEIISASNYGSQQGAISTGLDLKKKWLATRDSRTRADHGGADGQVRALDKPYNVGGDKLGFPGDYSLGASADNLVNCRCTEIYEEA